jgi:hypothetical protein
VDKTYPIDIYGVKNIGIEEWVNNYYAPLTGNDYQTIYENVFHAYTSTLKETDDESVYWVAISIIKLTHLISRYIFDSLKLLKLKEAGYEYVIGRKKEKIVDYSSTIHDLATHNVFDVSTIQIGFQDRAKELLKTIKHNFPGVINRKFYKNISHPYVLIGNRSQKELVAFCDGNKIFPVQVFPLMFARNSLNNSMLSLLNSQAYRFVHDFLLLVEKQYPFVMGSAFEVLEEKVKECFVGSLSFFYNNVAFLKHFKLKTLLVTSIGNPIERLCCSAWRHAGGEVIGFSHGNAYCTSYSPKSIPDGMLTIVNQYVTNSRGLELILKQTIEDFSLELNINTKIVHNKQNTYYPLFNNLQKCKPVRKIKRVMIIGFPMDNLMYAWFQDRHTLSSLHVELRLVKILKKAGYYVIYKIHPDRIHEADGIFEGYADLVLKSERMEDVYGMADCLLFSHANTTTFGFSLLTNKPIVLITVRGETWFPMALELLRRRCCIVNAEPDGSGRILFDEQNVIDGIKKSINNINYDILYEFAF